MPPVKKSEDGKSAVKITLHQDYFKNHESILIPDTTIGQLQVFDMDIAAGGSDRPFILRYVVLESVNPDDYDTEDMSPFDGTHLNRIKIREAE